MDITHLRNIERLTLYLVPVAGLLGLLYGPRSAAGALLGALVTAANFMGIRRIAERLQSATPKQQRKLLMMLALKFGGLMVVVGLIVRYVPIDRIAFLFGFSSFIVAITVESVRRIFSTQETSDDEPGTPSAPESTETT
jgi:hypothetical protein